MDTSVKIEKIVSSDTMELTSGTVPEDCYKLVGIFSWSDGAAWNLIILKDGTIKHLGKDEVIEDQDFRSELKESLSEYGDREKELSESVINNLS